MNILFFLSPKQDLMYVYDDFTLRQTLEKWENNRYASIPVLNRRGEYVGTLTEGDILWGLKKFHGLDLEAAEDVPISAFPHKRDYKAVTVTTSMDQLIEAAMNQNFVPVVDDRGIFIGIVRRQAIIRYCYEKSRAKEAPQPGRPLSAGKQPDLQCSTFPFLGGWSIFCAKIPGKALKVRFMGCRMCDNTVTGNHRQREPPGAGRLPTEQNRRGTR